MKTKLLYIIWCCVFCLAASHCCVSSSSDKLAQGLRSVEKRIPLPYHESLDKVVGQYAAMPLSETFVKQAALIDTALAQRGMPSELRYLPVALSGMKGNSRRGERCGVWLLPPLVAMHYGLRIDETTDERWDVAASTYAALDYLNDLYHQYNDWWQCILAYANSPSSLQHALIHHGGTPQLWDFKEQNLLPDTQVIANFIACTYLGEQGLLHFTAKDTLPSTTIVTEPATTTTAKAETPTKTTTTNKKNPSTPQGSGSKTYKVKKGDTLTSIASKYHVKVSDLKKWNHLKSDRIREGQTLTIKK